MKISLPLKLGIFVVLLFAVVIAVCLLWTPVRAWWYCNKLENAKDIEFVSIVKKIISLGDYGEQALKKYFNNRDTGWGKPCNGLAVKVEPSVLIFSEEKWHKELKLKVLNITRNKTEINYRTVGLDGCFSHNNNGDGFEWARYSGAPPPTVEILPGCIDQQDISLSIDFESKDKRAKMRFFGWRVSGFTYFQDAKSSNLIFELTLGPDITLHSNPIKVIIR